MLELIYSENTKLLKLSKDGEIKYVKPYADKTVNVTVKEKLNGQTRVVGKVKVKLMKPKVTKNTYTVKLKDTKKVYVKDIISETTEGLDGYYLWCCDDKKAPKKVPAGDDGDITKFPVSLEKSKDGRLYFKIKNKGKMYLYFYPSNNKTNNYYKPLKMITMIIK